MGSSADGARSSPTRGLTNRHVIADGWSGVESNRRANWRVRTVGRSTPLVWRRRPAGPLSHAARNVGSFVEHAGDHGRTRRRVGDPVRPFLDPSPAWLGQFRVGPRCSQTRGRVALNPGGGTRDRSSEVPNRGRTLTLGIKSCELLNIVLSVPTKRDQRGAVELSGP